MTSRLIFFFFNFKKFECSKTWTWYDKNFIHLRANKQGKFFSKGFPHYTIIVGLRHRTKFFPMITKEKDAIKEDRF